MNCIDNNCKYSTTVYVSHGLDTFACTLDTFVCTLTNEEIPDNIDEIQCDSFKQLKSCLDCKFSHTTEYETGTIDDIEYRCKKHNKELIYDNTCPMTNYNAEWLECPYGEYEQR